MAGTRHSELEQGIDCRAGGRLPIGSCAQTRMTPSSVSGHVAHPSVAPGDDPLPRQRMMLMRWYQEGHEHVDIEQAGHYG